MVEIGDGFRIPELIESTGARLREVGTTNRVHLADYAEAVGPETALRAQGAPVELPGRGLHRLGRRSPSWPALGVPVVADIGSGLLAPHPLLPDEPDAATALRAGAALVTGAATSCSAGRRPGCCSAGPTWSSGCAAIPLARALRVDKLTLAALEATLGGPAHAGAAVLTADADVLPAAPSGSPRLSADAGRGGRLPAAAVGGGGAPGVELPALAVALPAAFAAPLRLGRPRSSAGSHDGRLPARPALRAGGRRRRRRAPPYARRCDG